MTTPLPKLTDNRELHEAVSLAKELRLEFEFNEHDSDHELLIKGTGAQKLAPRFQTFMKKGVVQGNQGPNGLRLAWDKGTAADIPQEDLYPVSKEACDEVLALIPSRITSHEQLEKLCGLLREGIDKAYPGIQIHHKAFGKGKWLLIQNIMLLLWVRSDGILNRVGMIIVRELLCHLQAADGLDYGRLGYPPLPPAFAE